ncbi:AEC family transporter [Waterburya agarophytonicola K14]|uniref:AEC family transporter n=1 Tax=Waterburya agarophytonicola KI4 TaxID=2874699 RepID=A0A964FGC9_9CYAN|nr:AEC family transporter [Waterburya agarophytonicola]MCC0178720.1 AEC family transporter [Waterburya agarophytonicola KI4]
MLVILQSILWAVFGTILYREKIVGENLPRLLGRTLYWLGVPLQIFFLARKSNFDGIIWLPPLMTIVVLIMGLVCAVLVVEIFKQLIFVVVTKLTPQNQLEGLLLSVGLSTSLSTRQLIDRATPKSNASTGSFILASILGNTGFIGLALVPPLVDSNYWSWIVLYGLAHNVLGSYGIGVLIADCYSYSESKNDWWIQLQNLLFLPSLWAFAYGYFSREISFPRIVETTISQGVLFVVPGAFILIGMQLSKLQKWQNLSSGILPTTIKMIVIPALAGLLFTLLGMSGDSRLALVLMSSMPTAFASIILAEEYNLDRQIAASSILLSTLALPIVIFIWLTIF